MSTSDGLSKMELNIQISSPKGRLLNRLSSFPSNSSPLHSKGVPLSSDNNNNNNNNWWEWGGSNLSGVACMVISSISYSFMGLFVKLLSVSGVPSSEVVLCRCTIVAVLAGAGLKRMRHPLLGSPEVRQLVLARAFVGYIALSTYFYSARFVMQGDATVDPMNNIAVGIVAALLGSSLGALSYVIVRSIGRQGEPPLVCVFAFAAFSAPFSAVAMFFQGLKVPILIEAAGLVMVGLTAFTAQVFLTRGLQLEKAAKASSLQHLKVICTYLLGVAFLGETPSLVSFLGALLVAGSAISITNSKN